MEKKLAAEYALNVVEKGVACCDQTCNNPMLNQMVVNLISLPGVLSPEMVEKFKLAIEKMAAKELEQQQADRKALLERLSADPQGATSAEPPASEAKEKADAAGKPKPAEAVKGYKMEEMNTSDQTSALASSGVQWMASVFVLLLLGLFFWGLQRRKQEG